MEQLVNKFMDRFEQNRITFFVNNWWRIPIIKDKQEAIEQGIRSYLNGDFIVCIKTLYSEIEGIVRIAYYNEKGKDPTQNDIIDYIVYKAKSKFVSLKSLGFPDIFFRYLKETIFAVFDMGKGKLDFSRNTALHGIAKPNEYTKAKALQAILTIDQIYRYMS